jgi:hypothetical protein
MSSSYAVVVLVTFVLLTMVIFYQSKPVTEQPSALARAEPLPERLQEVNSPRPDSEPISNPDRVSQKTFQRREIPERRQLRKERIQRRIASPDFVAVRLNPSSGLTRGESSPVPSESRILHIPENAKQVHFHLKIPEDSSPGLYTVMLKSVKGTPLFNFQGKSRNGKVVIVSVPAERLPEGAYILHVVAEDVLLGAYEFSVAKRRALGFGVEGETQVASAPVAPKCNLKSV